MIEARRFTDDGLLFILPLGGCQTIGSREDEIGSFLTQIIDDGYGQIQIDQVLLPWAALYRLLEDEAYPDSLRLLGLPAIEDWRPILREKGTLSDPEFSISITGWVGPEGLEFSGTVHVEGAVIIARAPTLLPAQAWATVSEVKAFSRRPPDMRCLRGNQLGWARIRKAAVAARAKLSDYLRTTTVVTPEHLAIGLRRNEAAGVVEVTPGFDGEPDKWLAAFDRLSLRERYDVPHGNEIVHVLFTPEALSVLREVKSMPGRRVAGERARAFVSNPYNFLGEKAADLIEASQIEQALTDAGIGTARFFAHITTDASVGISIEETLGSNVSTSKHTFLTRDELASFVSRGAHSLEAGYRVLFWEGYELDLFGDAEDELKRLTEALERWRPPKSITLAELLDLSHYTERSEGFGVDKPFYIPYIARKSEGQGWLPDNADFGIQFPGDNGPVAVSLGEENLDAFERAHDEAKRQGLTTFIFPGCPTPITIEHAETLLSGIKEARKDISSGEFDPNRAKPDSTKQRQTLLIKPNVDQNEYVISRGSIGAFASENARLPESLRDDMRLLPHQVEALAWLQHLWGLSPASCRGALLADDMGLGKTLEILAFVASCFEIDPSLAPALIVAPVSLLDNWEAELDRFFYPESLPYLRLHGADKRQLLVSKYDIGADVQRFGVDKLLREAWIGDNRIVLTNYETLRDLELSLAREAWSIVVFDEAQTIKNPGALVTKAAKKQKARFAIACTGTPVENTLADLWCLFDLIQPGLLGSLSHFSTNYRRPIEGSSDPDRQPLEDLRSLIKPQVLRRMKVDVANDLPQKHDDAACKTLPMSAKLKQEYASLVRALKSKALGGGTAFGMSGLHLLKSFFAHPTAQNGAGVNFQPGDTITGPSPKLEWLIMKLAEIRSLGEKAIVFCELRDVQRTIQSQVSAHFQMPVDIVNGDSSISYSDSSSRRRRIEAFQKRDGFGVIILSPLVAGFGLNIQEANHVIHYTRLWNPAKEDQATDRAYRIGQTKDVHVYCPVVVSPEFKTFDVMLDELLTRKRALSADMLNGASAITESDFKTLENIDGSLVFDEAE